MSLVAPAPLPSGGIDPTLYRHVRSDIICIEELHNYFNAGDLNSRSLWDNESTALLLACQEGISLRYIRLLIESGASIFVRNALGATPLIVASEAGHFLVVKLLIEESESDSERLRQSVGYMPPVEYIAAYNQYKQTALMLAIERSPSWKKSGHIQIIKWIAGTNYRQLYQKNKYDKDALVIACEFGKYRAARFILTFILNKHMIPNDMISWRYDWDGTHWFMRFKSSDHHTTQKLVLFEHGNFLPQVPNEDRTKLMETIANINSIRANENTPLMYACGGTTLEHVQIVSMLLTLPGINIMESAYGITAILWAANDGNAFIIKRILDFYFDARHTKTMDQVIAHQAMERLCQYGHERSMSLLLHYVKYTYDHITVRSIHNAGLRSAWLHGNVKIATVYFMIDDPVYERCLLRDGYNDVLFGIRRVLESDAEVDEMYKRLQNKPHSIKALFAMAPLYYFHFEILINLLYKLDNPLAYIDKEIETFYSGMVDGKVQNLHLRMCYQCIAENTGVATARHNASKENNSGLLSADFAAVDAIAAAAATATVTADEKTDIEELKKLSLRKLQVNYVVFLTDVDVVEQMVALAVFFNVQRNSSSMVQWSWDMHEERAETVLERCFSASSMADSDTMQKFLPAHNFCRHSIIRDAHAFRYGPLHRCIDHNVMKAFRSLNVITFVNKLYWGFLSPLRQGSGDQWAEALRKKLSQLAFFTLNPSRRDIGPHMKNIVELRSPLLHLRSSPVSMFYLEGVSKLVMLLLVVMRAVAQGDGDSDGGGNSKLNLALIIWLVSTYIYEFGELCGNTFLPVVSLTDARLYFDSIWNRIDCVSNAIVLIGLVVDNFSTARARVWFAVAAIFLSLNMLQYAAAYEAVGQLIFMIFAMMKDLMQFGVIFLICVFGFCVAVYSIAIAERNPDFGTEISTFVYLFLAVFGNTSNFLETYGTYSTVNQVVSLGIAFTYMVFAAVMLLNLVIARMSATYSAIDSHAVEAWQYNRALTVANYLLIEERSPLSMLPPPFNLLSASVGLLDYLQVLVLIPLNYTTQQKVEGIQILSIAGTTVDVFIAVLMSFLSPLLELGTFVYKSFSSTDRIGTLTQFCSILALFPLTYFIYVVSLLANSINIRKYMMWRAEKDAQQQPINTCPSTFPIVFFETENPYFGNKSSHLQQQHSSLSMASNSQIEEVVRRTVNSQRSSSSSRVNVSGLISIKVVKAGNEMLMKALKEWRDLAAFYVIIRLQNIVAHTGQCFRHPMPNWWLFKSSTVFFPMQMLKMQKTDDIELSFTLVKEEEEDEVVATTTIGSSTVKQWIANGRFEGPLHFDDNKGDINITFYSTFDASLSVEATDDEGAVAITTEDNYEALSQKPLLNIISNTITVADVPAETNGLLASASDRALPANDREEKDHDLRVAALSGSEQESRVDVFQDGAVSDKEEEEDDDEDARHDTFIGHMSKQYRLSSGRQTFIARHASGALRRSVLAVQAIHAMSSPHQVLHAENNLQLFTPDERRELFLSSSDASEIVQVFKQLQNQSTTGK